ncbi:1,2-dihydroxy-3-keto-5-methylthiopentene dioxygenase [Vararia minispora EC-137]|uniref:1,2-dihydroxy-3-keto-5-methylthiopentene dioxygenase n=1 Tax=Vararia minispora EC-137 TaxID=1314806 RepID=A0ACB8QGZ8_9AGAM|nr:1,2-dihydroxy-3-keto-5-methylthiopentene dioxygenase [Vararia minispora EC-137]
MRSYYFDNLPGDQRLLHDSGREVTVSQLEAIGARYWRIPIDEEGRWEDKINDVAHERNYKNRDVINVTKEGLGEAYESKLKMFYEEHMHEDEEIRYILDGSGFFDLREHPTDNWIRVHLVPGDLLVVPAGIYHRFTLDEANKIQAMRLFKEEPKWTPHNRNEATDNNPYRIDYLSSLQTITVA